MDPSGKGQKRKWNINNINYPYLPPLLPVAKICRICLQGGKLVPLLDSVFLNSFESITGIKVNENDELPKSICQECLSELNRASLFIVRSRHANEVLTKHILSKGKNEVEKSRPDVPVNKKIVKNAKCEAPIEYVDKSQSGHLKCLLCKHYFPNGFDLKNHAKNCLKRRKIEHSTNQAHSCNNDTDTDVLKNNGDILRSILQKDASNNVLNYKNIDKLKTRLQNESISNGVNTKSRPLDENKDVFELSESNNTNNADLDLLLVAKNCLKRRKIKHATNQEHSHNNDTDTDELKINIDILKNILHKYDPNNVLNLKNIDKLKTCLQNESILNGVNSKSRPLDENKDVFDLSESNNTNCADSNLLLATRLTKNDSVSTNYQNNFKEFLKSEVNRSCSNIKDDQNTSLKKDMSDSHRKNIQSGGCFDILENSLEHSNETPMKIVEKNKGKRLIVANDGLECRVWSCQVCSEVVYDVAKHYADSPNCFEDEVTEANENRKSHQPMIVLKLDPDAKTCEIVSKNKKTHQPIACVKHDPDAKTCEIGGRNIKTHEPIACVKNDPDAKTCEIVGKDKKTHQPITCVKHEPIVCLKTDPDTKVYETKDEISDQPMACANNINPDEITNYDIIGSTEEEITEADENLNKISHQPIVIIKDDPDVKKCKTCGSQISSRTAHYNLHSDCIPRCKVCTKLIRNRKEFMAHKIKHSEELKVFKCNVCYRIFKNETNLKTHAREHDDATLLICEFCGTGFSTMSSIKLHIKNFHSNLFEKGEETNL